MQVLIYAAPFNTAGQRLLKGIGALTCVQQCEYLVSIATLAHRLRQPFGQMAIGILVPSDQRELGDLVSMRHLMRDMRIVLVLPNGHADMLSDGHVLRPRFVSYSDGDLSDVAAVVHKMIATTETDPLQAVR